MTPKRVTEWRAANPGKVRAARKRWRDKNPDYHRNKYLANKEQHRARMKQWYIDNRIAVIARTRANKVLRDYGLTPDALDALMTAHGHRCAICRTGVKLVIDHDHRSGVVRGILCDDCNVGIGRLKDDPGLLMSALAYLSRMAAEVA